MCDKVLRSVDSQRYALLRLMLRQFIANEPLQMIAYLLLTLQHTSL